jgi:hypothetical protein
MRFTRHFSACRNGIRIFYQFCISDIDIQVSLFRIIYSSIFFSNNARRERPPDMPCQDCFRSGKYGAPAGPLQIQGEHSGAVAVRPANQAFLEVSRRYDLLAGKKSNGCQRTLAKASAHCIANKRDLCGSFSSFPVSTSL